MSGTRPSTPNDLEMTDTSPVPSPRQPLPTSLASFALQSSSAPSSPSSSSTMVIDRDVDFTWPGLFVSGSSVPLIRKIRRSSLRSSLGGIGELKYESFMLASGSRSARASPPAATGPVSVFPEFQDEVEEQNSPIAESPVERSNSTTTSSSDLSNSLRVGKRSSRQMNLDTYLASPLEIPTKVSGASQLTSRPLLDPGFVPSPPSTKPIDVPKNIALKPARLLAVLQESTLPQDAEVQSEASFQKLVSSSSSLPLAFLPRTPRSARGRFPEEVGGDDEHRRDTNSDEDDEDVVLQSEDDSRWLSENPSMDVDMGSASGSPSISSSVTHSLMSTPQPVNATPQNLGGLNLTWRDHGISSSSGRAAKRKHTTEDRFEPYAYPTAKRRAVSPSITLGMGGSGSSPGANMYYHQHVSASPIPRSPISVSMSPYPSNRSVHSSPILRPVHRLPGGREAREREERERARQVSGAGEGVRQIRLNEPS